MEALLQNLDVILTVVLALMSTIFGAKWDKWKKKAADGINAGKTSVDFLSYVLEAARDNKLTNEEVEEIKKQFDATKQEVMDLFEKNQKTAVKRKMKRG